MNRSGIGLAGALALGLMGSVGIAPHGGNALAQASQAPTTTGTDVGQVVLDTVFDEVEKRILRAYGLEQEEKERDRARGNGNGKGQGQGAGNGGRPDAPPGLLRKDGLPPGLARREVLPPGLQGRGLPEDLEARLPPAKPGTRRVAVENDVVLIEEGTRRVLDVLEDVLLSPN